VKPAAFEYRNPSDEGEVFDLLAKYGSDAKVLAGGQSLIPLMNFRLVRPGLVVDINGVSSLKGVNLSDSTLRLGALTRHVELETRSDIAQAAPLLAMIAPYIGHPQIRTRGTLGGSLSHADPSAELPAAMVALDATILLKGNSGEREVPAEEFFKFHLTADLAVDELVVGVEMPVAGSNQGFGFKEVSARFGDFATVGAVAVLSVGADGKVERSRVVCMAVGPKPVRVRAAEAVLNGKPISAVILSELTDAVAEAVDPIADLKASASYKRRTAATLARRAVEMAWEMTTGRAS
jgi:carbon-monoxide dehydrogenase medium subunit